jgi:hypothetical protein
VTTAVAFSSDGSHLACAREDGSVTIYAFGLDVLRQRASTMRRRLSDADQRDLRDLAWSDDAPSWREKFDSFLKRLAKR